MAGITIQRQISRQTVEENQPAGLQVYVLERHTPASSCLTRIHQLFAKERKILLSRLKHDCK